MVIYRNIGSGNYFSSSKSRNIAPVFSADFTSLSAGAASTLFGLTHTRASSAATVQTGTSTLVTGLGTDIAGIGRALDADPLGLVIDCSSTNLIASSRNPSDFANGWFAGTGTTTYAYANGPDGVTSAARYNIGTTQLANYWADPVTSQAGTGSQFVRATTGTTALQFVVAQGTVGIFGVILASLNTTFKRLQTYGDPSTSTIYVVLADGRDQTLHGGQVATAQDIVSDCCQFEQLKYATEFIYTAGATATRAGARLYHPTSQIVSQSRRLELRLLLQAKGATTDYTTSPYLFRYDASNYATISNSTGTVTIVIGGSSYTTASGVTWAQNDVLDIRIMCGGGLLNSIVKISKNGGAFTTLGTSGSPQGNLPASGNLDLLQDGSAGNVFSSRVRKIQTYSPNGLVDLP